MEQAPEEQASAKLTQHLAVAVQVAESVMRLRQQRAERSASTDSAAAGAARAERVAQHAADRLVWSPALDRDWLANADLHDLGRAWGSATGWADTDRSADAAARRVETRLSDVAPNAMARFDELRETGWTRTDAMADVLASVASEAHASERTDQRRVFVAEGGSDRRPPAAARFFGAVPDDHVAARADQPAEGRQPAALLQGEGGAEVSGAPESTFIRRRVTETGAPHPADVAADSQPKPFTEVTPAPGRTLPPSAPTPTAARPRTLSR